MAILPERQVLLAGLRNQRVSLALAFLMVSLSAVLDRWLLGLQLADHLLVSHKGHITPIHFASVVVTYGLSVLFCWASFNAPYRWRIVYWLAFTFATAFAYGYVRGTGDVPGPSEIFVAFQASGSRDAVALAGVDWRASIIIGAYAIALALAPRGRSRPGLTLAAVCVVTFAFHSASLGYRVHQGEDSAMLVAASRPDIVSGTTQAVPRTIVNFAWFVALDAMSNPPRHTPVTYRSPTRPTNNIVLVIDESVRADHLSINGYRRATTPWLDSLQKAGKLTNWGAAASGGTSSYLSVSSIFSGVALPDRARKIFRQPSIFQYARAMGYETTLFDGQMARPVYGYVLDDGERYSMLSGQLRATDSYRDTKEFGDNWTTDFRIARAVRELLKRPNGQFIVILKRGNHLPFYNNYPPEARKWGPKKFNGVLRRTGNDRHDVSNWAKWVDVYDDGIRYNLDQFFRNLLDPDGSLPRTVVIYTSDHGQPYFPENEKEWRTASSVPLLMFGDARPEVDPGYRASHHNIFATLLDLMAFPPVERKIAYGRSLISARRVDHDPRMVFEGGELDTAGLGPSRLRDFDKLPAADPNE